MDQPKASIACLAAESGLVRSTRLLESQEGLVQTQISNSLALGPRSRWQIHGVTPPWPGAEGKETREEEGAPGTALFVKQTASASASVLHQAGRGIAITSSRFEG
jgi:hypothetical protein